MIPYIKQLTPYTKQLILYVIKNKTYRLFDKKYIELCHMSIFNTIHQYLTPYLFINV